MCAARARARCVIRAPRFRSPACRCCVPPLRRACTPHAPPPGTHARAHTRVAAQRRRGCALLTPHAACVVCSPRRRSPFVVPRAAARRAAAPHRTARTQHAPWPTPHVRALTSALAPRVSHDAHAHLADTLSLLSLRRAALRCVAQTTRTTSSRRSSTARSPATRRVRRRAFQQRACDARSRVPLAP